MIFSKNNQVQLEDPDESIVELTRDETYKEEKRSALHNLETVTWLRKRKRKQKQASSNRFDPAKVKYENKWPDYIKEEEKNKKQRKSGLHFNEFKLCSQVYEENDGNFVKIMRELRKRNNKKDDKDPKKPLLIPMTFLLLIKLFSYKTQRNYLTDLLKKKTAGLDENMEKIPPYQVQWEKTLQQYQLSHKERVIQKFLEGRDFKITDARDHEELVAKKLGPKKKSANVQLVKQEAKKFSKVEDTLTVQEKIQKCKDLLGLLYQDPAELENKDEERDQKVLEAVLQKASFQTKEIIHRFAKNMQKAIQGNFNDKSKYKKLFTQATVMQKQALEIQQKAPNYRKTGVLKPHTDKRKYGMQRNLTRIEKWEQNFKKKRVKFNSLSFYERYVRTSGVCIDPKFADEIEGRIDKAKQNSLSEVNRIIKVQSAINQRYKQKKKAMIKRRKKVLDVYIPSISRIMRKDLNKRGSLITKKNVRICEQFYQFKEQPLVTIAPKKTEEKDQMYNTYNKFAEFKSKEKEKLPYEMKRIDNIISQNLKFQQDTNTVFQWDDNVMKDSMSKEVNFQSAFYNIPKGLRKIKKRLKQLEISAKENYGVDIDKLREEEEKEKKRKEKLKKKKKADQFSDKHLKKNIFEKILPLGHDDNVQTDKAFAPGKYQSHYFNVYRETNNPLNIPVKPPTTKKSKLSKFLQQGGMHKQTRSFNNTFTGLSIPKVSLLKDKLPINELENLSGMNFDKSALSKTTYTFKSYNDPTQNQLNVSQNTHKKSSTRMSKFQTTNRLSNTNYNKPWRQQSQRKAGKIGQKSITQSNFWKRRSTVDSRIGTTQNRQNKTSKRSTQYGFPKVKQTKIRHKIWYDGSQSSEYIQNQNNQKRGKIRKNFSSLKNAYAEQPFNIPTREKKNLLQVRKLDVSKK